MPAQGRNGSNRLSIDPRRRFEANRVVGDWRDGDADHRRFPRSAMDMSAGQCASGSHRACACLTSARLRKVRNSMPAQKSGGGPPPSGDPKGTSASRGPEGTAASGGASGGPEGAAASGGAAGAPFDGPDGTTGECSNRPGGYSGESAKAGPAASAAASAMIERFTGRALATRQQISSYISAIRFLIGTASPALLASVVA